MRKKNQSKKTTTKQKEVKSSLTNENSKQKQATCDLAMHLIGWECGVSFKTNH